jgi:hypothetical protein
MKTKKVDRPQIRFPADACPGNRVYHHNDDVRRERTRIMICAFLSSGFVGIDGEVNQGLSMTRPTRYIPHCPPPEMVACVRLPIDAIDRP